MGSSDEESSHIRDFIARRVEELFSKTHHEAISLRPAPQVRQAGQRRQLPDRRREPRPGADRRQGPAERRSVAGAGQG